MNTFGKSLALAYLLVVGGLGFAAKPVQAQVGIGIATPGFSLGIGPGAGYGLYGGYYPAPVVVAPPVPVIVAPPIYGPRPYYGGYYGGYRGGYHGHHGGYYGEHHGHHYYRR